MRLYHGSTILVREPDLTKGKPFKDFGRGFYLSETFQQARERAEQMASLALGDTAVVSTFEFDESAMSDGSLNVKRFDSYSEEWADFVLRNRDRKQPQPIHNFDIVYGPIANDNVVRQMRRFELGDISMAELMHELQYSKGITFQYFFGSDRALKKLTFIC